VILCNVEPIWAFGLSPLNITK